MLIMQFRHKPVTIIDIINVPTQKCKLIKYLKILSI